MATSGKNPKKKQEKLPERDFFSEYNEIMKLAGRDLFSIESDWNHSSRHIKKFSLLRDTPTPILTDHTNPINF